MICNIIAINAAPPPAPATAVSAEVQSAATVRNTISNMVIIRFDFMVYRRTMQLYMAKAMAAEAQPVVQTLLCMKIRSRLGIKHEKRGDERWGHFAGP